MGSENEDWLPGLFPPSSSNVLQLVSCTGASEDNVNCAGTPKTYADISCAGNISVESYNERQTPAEALVQNDKGECEATNIQELKELLLAWNLEHIIDRLLAEKVYVNILKIIKQHHIGKLLESFDMGTQIRFEHCLEQWRQNLNLPFDGGMFSATTTFVPAAASPHRSESSCTSEHNSFSNVRFSPYSSRSPTPDEGAQVMLSNILNDTPKAHGLVEYYNTHKKFQAEQRDCLVTLVARYFEDRAISMSMATSYRLEMEILERFPSEKLEYYRTRKRGKLYNKWRNSCSRFKLTVSNPHPKSAKAKANSFLRSLKNLDPEEDAEACIQALKFDHLSIEEFDNIWKACGRYRLNQIQTISSTAAIIEQWPFYKQPSGYRLIDLDYEIGFENRDGLLKQWKSEYPHILSFLYQEQHVKDKTVKAVLEKLKNVEVDENQRDAVLFWALHGYFVPTNKIVKTDVMGKKTTMKSTIRDSQASFLFLGKTVNEVEDHIMFLKERKESIQPFVYGVGDSIFEVKSIGLFFDNIRYQFFHVIRAIDICFKIIYVFNLNFPPESIMLWSFIEQYFFKHKSQIQYPKVHILCEFLQACKNQ